MAQAEIRQTRAMRVAAVEHIGPYSGIRSAFARLTPLLMPAWKKGDVCAMVALYWWNKEPRPEAEFRAHAGGVMAKGKRVPKGLEKVEIKAGRTLVYTHRGPYDGIAAGWADVMDRIVPATGVTPTGPFVWENYVNSPMDTAPEDLVTELCVPVE